MMKLLFSKKPSAEYTSLMNDEEIVKKNKCECKTYHDAIKKDHVECLKNIECDNERACNYAAEKGSLECLKYLCDQGYHIDAWTCFYASRGGKLECLKYLHEKKGCELSDGDCEIAVLKGHLDCVKYLHKNGCGFTYSAYENAVTHNRLECLKYLHENGSWDTIGPDLCTNLCFLACVNNNLECLKYLHENGCPWNDVCTSHEKIHENSECLRYALVNGCPYLKSKKEKYELIIKKYKG